jgi:hypothetical protein
VAIHLGFWPTWIERWWAGSYDLAMAKVQYQSKDDGGHRFWTARLGPLGHPDRRQSARPRPMGHHPGGRSIRSIGKGTAPGRDEAADAVSRVLEELLA